MFTPQLYTSPSLFTLSACRAHLSVPLSFPHQSYFLFSCHFPTFLTASHFISLTVTVAVLPVSPSISVLRYNAVRQRCDEKGASAVNLVFFFFLMTARQLSLQHVTR